MYIFIFLLVLGPLWAHNPCVVGVGEPIIDYIYFVDDVFLEQQHQQKGGSNMFEFSSFEFYQKLLEKQQPHIVPGGCSANTIKGLAKLGCQSRFIGKIGLDSSGSLFGQSLLNAGVTPNLLTTSTHTSLLLSMVTPDGERTMLCCLGAAHELKAEELTAQLFADVTHVHLDGYSFYIPGITFKTIERAQKAGATISLDLSSFEVVRLFKSEIESLLTGKVDVVFANEEEAYELTGLPPREACMQLQKQCKIAVVHIGKEGCWVGSNDVVFQAKPPKVTVIDTLGAGDLFASGFLYGWLHHMQLQECARIGNLLGSACVQTQGAAIPDFIWAEILPLCQAKTAEISLEK